MHATARQLSYSLIIPVHNAENTLKELYQRMSVTMDALEESYEIIFVDDCSYDDSWKVINQIAKSDNRCTGLRLVQNSGQGNTTIAGLRYSKGRFLITLDDDLQNPPEEIPKLIDALNAEENIDVVFGYPKNKQHTRVRSLGSAIQNIISSWFITRNGHINMTSFRLIRYEVAEPLFSMNVPVFAPGTLLATLTTRMVDLEVEHHPRTHGKSGYSITRLIRLSIARFLGLSFLPLRLLAVIGLLGSISSMIIASVYLILYLNGVVKLPGWLTLVLLMSIFSGFNFMALGILGESLHSILISVRNTPPYIVRNRTCNQSASEENRINR